MNEPIVDLETCAREPIHIPGAIQPHGVLLVLKEPELTIVQASENTDLFFGRRADHLVGEKLDILLTREQVDAIRGALVSDDQAEINPLQLGFTGMDGKIALEGILHQHDGFAILEFEPAMSSEGSANFLNFYKTVSKTTGRLQSAPDLQALVDEAAAGVRQMTGFDRVMIYRFADNGEGEVIAESKAETVDPYLGLRYPASDIPEQARRLYTISSIRCIPTVTYKPVPLVPSINTTTDRPTDLSHAGLRSVSPIHCEYLQNMGVSASMSVSVVREGKLWGLIACHHFAPKSVPYETRKACSFIGQILSGEIGRREAEANSTYNSEATSVQAKFLELIRLSAHPLAELVNSTPNLLDLIPAAGAAVVMKDKAQMIGVTPTYTEVMSIVASLRGADVPRTFSTRSLKNHFSDAGSMTKTASGVIALEISPENEEYILYFRPEVAQTVTWGGDPNKVAIATVEGFRLSPRKSFAAWREKLQGASLPWTANEVRAADELRKLVGGISHRVSPSANRSA